MPCKRFLTFLVTVAALSAVAAEDARLAAVEKAFGPPAMWVAKPKAPPVIDGKLDDAIWKEAEPLQGWGITDYGRQTGKLGDIDFRAAWDERYLYVGVRLYHNRKPEDMEALRRSL